MPTNNPNSAAVDAIARAIQDECGQPFDVCKAWAKRAFTVLRDHPEHGPWPVMTKRETRVFTCDGPYIVIPDPDPPAAVVPSVEAMQQLVEAACIEYHRSPGIKGNYAVLMNAIKYLVEAANGGVAK